MSFVEVTGYTDPVSRWSWGLERAMRKLGEEFAGEVRFTYTVRGMVRAAARHFASTAAASTIR
jgi:predicted DsbA family dithiol-disulfide isomerase